MERAAAFSARVFVRGFHDLDKMGLCPIFQEGFGWHGYGVLACSHIMHLDCRVLYEAYEWDWALNSLMECPICRARFQGFVCICV